MKALTLWQPWCAIIVDGYTRIDDPKIIENRPWKPWASIIGKRIALHAGKHYDEEVADKLFPIVSLGGIREGVLGAILGTAIVTGFVTKSTSRWWIGPYAWTLDSIRAVESIPCKGAQGLWNVPENIVERLVA